MNAYDELLTAIYKARDAETLYDSLAFMRVINAKTAQSFLLLTQNELNNIAITARLFVNQPRPDELCDSTYERKRGTLYHSMQFMQRAPSFQKRKRHCQYFTVQTAEDPIAANKGRDIAACTLSTMFCRNDRKAFSKH